MKINFKLIWGFFRTYLINNLGDLLLKFDISLDDLEVDLNIGTNEKDEFRKGVIYGIDLLVQVLQNRIRARKAKLKNKKKNK